MMDQPNRQQGSQFRAAIFDCDGTLVDSYPAITASVNHVRAAHGMPPLPEAEVRRSVGRGPAYLLKHTVPGTDVEKNLSLYRAHHPSVLRSGTQLLPGVGDTIRALSEAGFLLGVCSNKLVAFTRELLDYLGLARFFQAVIGPEDAPRPKPAPDMLLAALAKLGVGPSEALYVGDMTVDIETARAAGVTVWTVPTGSNERAELQAASPDRLLDDFRELTELTTHCLAR
jgi:phosphoglycolate phosphatase